MKFVLAAFCRLVWEAWTQRKRPMLPWHPYTIQLAPTGVAAAMDIGLSNWSFEFITVSLYTMSKSTAIIFIMGFALLFKLERRVWIFNVKSCYLKGSYYHFLFIQHWTLLAVVVMISGGLIMFTYHATQFSLIGFLMVITASFLRYRFNFIEFLFLYNFKKPIFSVVWGGRCLKWSCSVPSPVCLTQLIWCITYSHGW